MKNLVRIIGGLTAAAFAIAPMVTTLNAKVGTIIAIIAAGGAAFGPALIERKRRRSRTPVKPLRKRGGYGNVALALVLVTAILSAACGPNQIKKTAQGTLIAATVLDEGIELKRDFRNEGSLTRESELAITRSMLSADRALLTITDTAKCFELYTADIRANLIRASGDVISILDQLNRDGVLRIKSEDGQRRFRLWLISLRTASRGIQVALELIPAQPTPAEGSPAPQLSRAQREVLEEVREICARAGLRLRENETDLLNDIALLDATDQPPVVLGKPAHSGN